MLWHYVRLLQAVLQFYQSASGQADINRWLTNAQISPNAWSFAWQLIQPQKVVAVVVVSCYRFEHSYGITLCILKLFYHQYMQ